LHLAFAFRFPDHDTEVISAPRTGLFSFFPNLLAWGISWIILKVSRRKPAQLTICKAQASENQTKWDLRTSQQSETADNEAFTQTSGAAHGW
jgi:hypothetical protein